MKTFKEFKNPNIDSKPIFESHEVENLSESEVLEAERIYKEITVFVNENGIQNLDEGILGRIVGGIAGFVVGPAIGRIVANALGIERGILYDMLTSRIVSAALGSSIAKNMG
jgi:hypothetical protein